MARKRKNIVEPEVRTDSEIGVLVSRLDHPETIKYRGFEMRVSPRAKIRKVVRAFLQEPLPDGIVFIRHKK